MRLIYILPYFLETCPAAVTFKFFTVNIAGLVACEKQDCVSQVLRHSKLTGEVQQHAGSAKAELVGRRHDQRNVSYDTTG